MRVELQDAAGHRREPWSVRAGETILRTEWDHDARTLIARVGTHPEPLLDAALERVAELECNPPQDETEARCREAWEQIRAEPPLSRCPGCGHHRDTPMHELGCKIGGIERRGSE